MGKNTLWAGPDHLLLVMSTGFSENYRRFYYRDIRYIAAGKTARGKGINIFFALLLCLALFLTWSQDSPWFFGTLSGVLAIAFLVNLIKGPTCECVIETPVQKTRLHPIARLKKYRKCMELLLPLIEKEQGALPPEEMAEAAKTKSALPPEQPIPNTEKAKGTGTLLWHTLTYVSLSAIGALTLLNLSVESPALLFIVLALFFVTIILSVAAIVKHHRQHMPGFLRKLTWTVLLLNTAGTFISYFAMVISISIKNQASNNIYNERQAIEFLSSLPSEGGELFHYGSVFIAVVTLIPAIAGLLACLLEARERHGHDSTNQ